MHICFEIVVKSRVTNTGRRGNLCCPLFLVFFLFVQMAFNFFFSCAQLNNLFLNKRCKTQVCTVFATSVCQTRHTSYTSTTCNNA